MPVDAQKTDDQIQANGMQQSTLTPYDRSFEAAKRRREDEQRRSEKEQTAYIKKLKRRHIQVALSCSVIYAVLSVMISPAVGFQVLMLFAGAVAGYMLSLKDGGSILGVIMVGTPAIAISSLVNFMGLVEVYTATMFFSWPVYLAMGGLVGWFIESRD